MTVKIKICGITNLDDAQAAIEMGADILGFNFYRQSPRYIETNEAEKIICKLPGFVDIAGVFVNANRPDIRELTDSGLLNWVQFHGDETSEFCSQFNAWNLHTIKAVRVRSVEDIDRAQEFETFSLLFDAFDPNQYGGTGKTFDWSLLRKYPHRVFLAGGINPDNVSDALETDVYGIDICSGIESEPGKKDHPKMKQLFDNIHSFTGIKVRK
ncbi:MAG: phosphoribosylanthranilate isomerase [Planctomycetes bacterium]|nr:phosphoribosylanthranilate isomerase [Planctomycetota bacterium]